MVTVSIGGLDRILVLNDDCVSNSNGHSLLRRNSLGLFRIDPANLPLRIRPVFKYTRLAAQWGTTYSKIYLTLCRVSDRLILGGGSLSKNLKLKAARALKDMTQKDLAEAVGVSRQTINAIENGDYNPTIKLCREICKVLEKSLDDLFGEG